MRRDINEAFDAILSEREYQDKKWPEHEHSITEWLCYIQDYTNEALHISSREDDIASTKQRLDIIRKIAAMGVVCMQEHGAPKRKL